MLKKLIALLMAMFAAAAFAAVDVNTADTAALDGVKGIGPAIAAKITAERTKGGKFKDWDDLIGRVSGIGDKTAAKLSEAGLTVNGGTFKGVAAKPAAAAKPADAKTAAAPAATSAEDKKAAAKKEKEEKAAAKKKEKEEKAAKAAAAKASAAAKK